MGKNPNAKREKAQHKGKQRQFESNEDDLVEKAAKLGLQVDEYILKKENGEIVESESGSDNESDAGSELSEECKEAVKPKNAGKNAGKNAQDKAQQLHQAL